MFCLSNEKLFDFFASWGFTRHDSHVTQHRGVLVTLLYHGAVRYYKKSAGWNVSSRARAPHICYIVTSKSDGLQVHRDSIVWVGDNLLLFTAKRSSVLPRHRQMDRNWDEI